MYVCWVASGRAGRFEGLPVFGYPACFCVCVQYECACVRVPTCNSRHVRLHVSSGWRGDAGAGNFAQRAACRLGRQDVSEARDTILLQCT